MFFKLKFQLATLTRPRRLSYTHFALKLCWHREMLDYLCLCHGLKESVYLDQDEYYSG